VNAATNLSVRPQAILWYGFSLMAALLLGAMLARNWFTAAFSCAVILWAMTIPYHARLAIVLSTATFNSSLIVPFMPGPLPLADAACMLGWTGVVLIVALRRQEPDTGLLVHRNRFLFLGIALYVVVLAVTAYLRGVGFGAFGGSVGGGRLYFQQAVYAIVPVLFAVLRLPEPVFLRLITFHFVLSISFLISDVTLAYDASLGNIVFRFFQLPTDAFTFDAATTYRFAFRRLQSLFYVCPRIVFAILMYYSLREVLGRKAWWLVPAIVGLLALGLGSGHRANLIHTGVVLAVLAWVQRAYTPGRVLLVGGFTVVAVALLYVTSPVLPAAVQRSVSFLPGIRVDARVAANAAATWSGRIEVTRIGMGMIPEYFWLGRGFKRYTDIVPFSREAMDSVSYAVLQGHYLNGFVGLMVNTGIFGTLSMCILLAAGARLALEVSRKGRQLGFHTTLARTGSVVASIYLVDFVFFFLIEGNVDWAMRRFGMMAGILLACSRLLDSRLREEEEWAAEEAEAQAQAQVQAQT